MRSAHLILCAVVIVAAASVARAEMLATEDTLPQPTVVTAPSAWGRVADRAVNRSGVETDGEGYLVHSDTGGYTGWEVDLYDGAAFVGATGVFDFGEAVSVAAMNVWNWNETSQLQRGTTAVGIYAADSIDADPIPAEMTAVGTFDLAQAPGTSDYRGERFTFDSPITGRYFAVDLVDSYESNIAGLAEIAFIAVPEPMTMTLLGLGGLVALRRRRR